MQKDTIRHFSTSHGFVLRTPGEGQEWKLRPVRGHPCNAALGQDCGQGGNEKSQILDETP